MHTFLSIQHWLYSGMGDGLGAIAGGDPRAILLAMTAAILFGAIHALMPGHGKTVLVSYHLGQEARPLEGFINGAILSRRSPEAASWLFSPAARTCVIASAWASKSAERSPFSVSAF